MSNKPKRNPERAIAALRTAMAVYPDLRVAQVIANASYRAGGSGTSGVFYIEDDALAEALEAYVRG